MEPLKPSTKEEILRRNLQAAPGDIEEYERLLAERFMRDPSQPRSPAGVEADAAREQRLAELYEKLFNPSQ